ncbi:galactose-3-O-sulfotransferase 4-like isoform X2 [Ischnura elegans]|nr:galactose-3-O-sulfotransferase 4-like isoform X2 [Ischnura elegans]XP_046385292.1 galactose-3-O-sulfotransferase 4-like isoform X2 [Ischnura elegans]
MRTLQIIFCILLLTIVGFIGWQLNLLYKTSCSDSIHIGSLFAQINESREEGTKCQAKTSLFFLKTHKCGSSTVQNILMRFGRRHNLFFVLPESDNYLGNPEHFSPEFIGPKVQIPNGEKYDIFTHHTRYDHEAIRGIMKDGTPFVTIMRDPIKLQLSLYDYYYLQYFNDKSLPELLHQNLSEVEDKPRYRYRVGWNQISWDLGVDHSRMKMAHTLPYLVNKVENEFDLVMITEFMEASLVLLADLMCWPLEEVRFITANARVMDPKSNNKNIVLTDEEIAVLEKLNRIDIQLYSHFKQRFKQLILEYGRDRMMSDVNRLVDMNNKLYRDCIASIRPPNKNQVQVTQYELKPDAPKTCREVLLPELKFTDGLRSDQEKRVAAIKKLRDFLDT